MPDSGICAHSGSPFTPAFTPLWQRDGSSCDNEKRVQGKILGLGDCGAWVALAAAAFLTVGCANARAGEDKHALAKLTQVREKLPPPSASAILCPEEMAEVGSVCVDRWEAHLVLRTKVGTEPFPYSKRPKAGDHYEAQSSPSVKPQGYISREESKAACSNAGKRLCSVSEWYQACSGTQHTTYPYGEKFTKGSCNVARPHLLSRRFGNNPRAWRYAEHFNNPTLNQTEGWLANTGAFEACESDYGVHDMVGNLHEWVDGEAGPAVAKALRLKPEVRQALVPHRRGRGVFMGGFYSTLSEHGEGCTFVTMAHEPTYHDYSTGFRCCKDL